MNYYQNSRLTKKEEKKAYRKIAFAVFGSIILLIFIVFYGLPALINMAVFISNIKGEKEVQTSTTNNSPIPPPSLEAPYDSTNSATISIKGSASAGMVVEVFVNAQSFKRLLIPQDGNFKIDNIKLNKGQNSFWAFTENSVHQKSERSDIVTVIYKNEAPKIEISNPNDGATISNDTKNVQVSGTTEDGISVTVNGRMAIVDPDFKFSYTLPLNDGDNNITIIATDAAGNTTKIERKVKYQAP